MDTLDCQVAYWNEFGLDKRFHHPVRFDRLADWLAPEDLILDYGCGYGRVLALLRARGYLHLIGVDAAAAMVAEARRRHPVIPFEHLPDPPTVALPSASVAAVLLFTVLTCVPTDAGQRAIVEEITRVLRPGGLLYISDLWLQTDARNLQRYVNGEHTHGTYGVFDLPEGVTLRHHDPRWIDRLTAGYRCVALDGIEVETMNGHLAAGFQWFGLKQG